MNKITIGIPKALLFYKYGNLWMEFFENLGLDVIISPNTTKETLEIGKKYVIDESCLSMKIYMGHIDYLKDKCDYILIPRIDCLKKGEKVCTNFMSLYDLTNNLFNINILNYNIDVTKGEDEEFAFITMGLELGFKLREIKKAYKDAKEEVERINNKKISRQNKIIAETDNIKVLIAGHPYNIYDSLIGKGIIEYLKNNNIDILYSDIYNKKYLETDYKRIAPKNYFTYNKEIIASIASLDNKIDGIILITTFPCGPDSLSNEMIIRNVKSPLISLIIDELNSSTGLITRLESFIDIIKERKNLNETRNY